MKNVPFYPVFVEESEHPPQPDRPELPARNRARRCRTQGPDPAAARIEVKCQRDSDILLDSSHERNLHTAVSRAKSAAQGCNIVRWTKLSNYFSTNPPLYRTEGEPLSKGDGCNLDGREGSALAPPARRERTFCAKVFVAMPPWIGPGRIIAICVTRLSVADVNCPPCCLSTEFAETETPINHVALASSRWAC
jgi:hypothetical protein